MRKCLHCGEMCEDNITICPRCGALVETYTTHKEYMDVYHVNRGKRLKNKKIILWFFLGLVLPYIGFIVSWVIYDGEREKAKALIFGAIVSTVITTFLPYILLLFMEDNDPSKNNESNSNGGQQIKSLIEIYKNL